jgi:glutamine synthetase
MFSLQTLPATPKCPEDLPEWNYDGSSTGQAPGHNSEVIIKYVINIYFCFMY